MKKTKEERKLESKSTFDYDWLFQRLLAVVRLPNHFAAQGLTITHAIRLSYRSHLFHRKGGLRDQSTPRIQPARSFVLPAKACSRSLPSDDTNACTFRDGIPTDNSQTLNGTISQSEFMQTAIPLTVGKCGLPWREWLICGDQSSIQVWYYSLAFDLN